MKRNDTPPHTHTHTHTHTHNSPVCCGWLLFPTFMSASRAQFSMMLAGRPSSAKSRGRRSISLSCQMGTTTSTVELEQRSSQAVALQHRKGTLEQ